MTDFNEIPKKVRAHTIYKNKADEIVPGVTTVLGILNKPALVKWANNLGLQGIDSTKYVSDLASIGTLTHSMIEGHLMASPPDLSEYSPDEITKAKVAFEKYLKWEKEQKLEPILIEKLLVSELFQFGGQIDLYAKLNGKRCLIDFKTCKTIYPEHMYQLAAYQSLLIENGFAVNSALILRVGRDESEGFEVKEAGDLQKDWQIFEHALEIYKLKKER